MSGPPQTRDRNTPVDWYTPPSIFAALGLQFDLDPCAPPAPAMEWLPARERISLPADGLAVNWGSRVGYHGGHTARVWLNPPYGDQAGKWVGKLAAHGCGIALVFARTDADWWQACAAKATAVCFLAQRVSFVPGHRSDRSCKSPNAAAPSCLLAYGGTEAQACADSGLGLTVDCRELLSPPQLQGAFC